MYTVRLAGLTPKNEQYPDGGFVYIPFFAMCLYTEPVFRGYAIYPHPIHYTFTPNKVQCVPERWFHQILLVSYIVDSFFGVRPSARTVFYRKQTHFRTVATIYYKYILYSIYYGTHFSVLRAIYARRHKDGVNVMITPPSTLSVDTRWYTRHRDIREIQYY